MPDWLQMLLREGELETAGTLALERSVFGRGEVKVGIVLAGGSHTRIPAQIPWAVAVEMLLMSRPIRAERAYQVGLVNALVPSDEVLDTTIEWAKGLPREAQAELHRPLII